MGCLFKITEIYEIFRKVNDSDTKVVVIKRPRFQNDDILMTDYSNINTSTIIPCAVEQKINPVSQVLTEAAMYAYGLQSFQYYTA